MTKLFNCCGLWATGRTFANAIAVGIGGGVGFGALIYCCGGVSSSGEKKGELGL